MAEIVWDQVAHIQTERLEEAAPGATDLILEVVDLLGDHPLIGRSVEHDFRELVISRGNTGYIALYRYDEALDIVFVLTVRHQREAGLPDA